MVQNQNKVGFSLLSVRPGDEVQASVRDHHLGSGSDFNWLYNNGNHASTTQTVVTVFKVPPDSLKLSFNIFGQRRCSSLSSAVLVTLNLSQHRLWICVFVFCSIFSLFHLLLSSEILQLNLLRVNNHIADVTCPQPIS